MIETWAISSSGIDAISIHLHTSLGTDIALGVWDIEYDKGLISALQL